MDEYLPIVLMAVAGVIQVGLFWLVHLGAPRRRPTAAKSMPYECGITSIHEPPQRFPVRFYLVAMVFIVFDIEIVFLYPWAIVFHHLGTFGLVEIVVFSAVVFVAYLYLVANGALTWGPTKRVLPLQGDRTTLTTVRRVSAPQRTDGATCSLPGRPRGRDSSDGDETDAPPETPNSSTGTNRASPGLVSAWHRQP